MRRDRGDDTWEPEMPPVDFGGYLAGYLFEVGPVLSGGMGAAQITHSEIAHWQSNVGIRLQPWEVRWLRRLSLDYLIEQQRATDRNCPPPWESPDQQPDLDVVSRSTHAAISALISNKDELE